MANGRTRLERETVIVFNEAEPDARVWTTSEVQRRRLERQGWSVTARGGGWEAVLPKTRVAVRKPGKQRELSDEQLAALVLGRPAKIAR